MEGQRKACCSTRELLGFLVTFLVFRSLFHILEAMKVSVIPNAHHSHSTNFLDVQSIKNTSIPNTPQLTQTQAINTPGFPLLSLCSSALNRQMGGSHQHLPPTCVFTSTKRGDRNHPSQGPDDDASSTVDKLLPIRTQVVAQVFLHRVRGWKSSRRLGFSEQDPVQGDTISSCSLGSQDLHFKSAAAERELE